MYHYPYLTHIDPVLKAMQGVPGFIRVDTPHGFSTLDYVYTIPGITFRDRTTLSPEEVTNEYLRREIRGIKFCPNSGKILARPYHKWFNIGQMQECDAEHVHLTDEAVYLDKLDGSMIHPCYTPHGSPLCTRKGITDVSRQAEAHIQSLRRYRQFINVMRGNRLTPMFEWCSPKNPIVLHHESDTLIVTNIRDMRTGTYLSPEARDRWAHQFGIPTAAVTHIKTESTQALVDHIRPMTGIEGYIIIQDGEFYKIKTKDYEDRHRNFDILNHPKAVLDAVISQTEDDAVAGLDEDMRTSILDYAATVRMRIIDKTQAMVDAHPFLQNPGAYARKDYVAAVKASDLPGILFKAFMHHYTGDHIRDHILDHIQQGFSTPTKKDAYMTIYDIPTWVRPTRGG